MLGSAVGERSVRRCVVVHCHHGASRTGLALRAWLMRTNGWDEPTATAHLAQVWPRLDLWNRSVTSFLQSFGVADKEL